MTDVRYESVKELIEQELREAFEEQGLPTDDIDEQTRLFGEEGLDSVRLASFIIDVEGRLDGDLGIPVVLADERAMSRQRSPFRSVKALADYVMELAAGSNHE